MTARPRIRTMIVELSAAMLIAAAPAQAQVTLEAHAGLGYTSVNVDNWAGSSLNDWRQTAYVGYVQAFLLTSKKLSLGAELGNEYFFWYNVAIPFGSSTILSDRNVKASRVMAVVRLQGAGKIFGEAALGAHLFDGFTDGGAAAAIGYMLGAGGEKLSIPLKIRADFVNDPDVKMTTITATVGLSFRL